MKQKGRIKEAVFGACTVITHQFPESPEGQLMAAVVCCAVMDLHRPTSVWSPHKFHVDSAREYLSGEMWHAEICGVDSDWIRSVLDKAGIDWR